MSMYRRRKLKDLVYEREPETSKEIDNNIEDNIKFLKDTFKDANDLVFREFNIGGPNGKKLFMCYIDGMADKLLLDEFVLNPLMLIAREVKPDFEDIKERLVDATKNSAMAVSDFKEVEKMEDALTAIMSGETALFLEDYSKVFIIATRSWPARGPSEPSAETVIRGPRDGFVETMRFNTALVRRRIRDTELKIKQVQCGKRSKTDIAILYIDDIADKGVLKEVEEKIKNINIDAILDSGYVQQFLEERHITPFPQVQTTERPDVVAAALYEGRVAILVDNSPFALIVPATLNAFFQSAEDYYSRSTIVSFVRNLRLISGFLSLIAPALYIALVAFHPAIIPASLALSIAATREGVPFPAFIEAIIMELTLEFLREAGVRLPRPIGSTIGIVGGLVIGQAAVSAGIVSPIMVIVVALTAIASFSIPNYEVAAGFRLIRFLLMLFAAVYGLYGVVLGLIATLVHLVNLKSFGVPYLSPVAPLSINDMKDGPVMRLSWTHMKKRPEHLDPKDKIRQGGEEDDSK